MHTLSNKTGSFSNGETSWEDGDFRSPSKGKEYIQRLIDSANSVPIGKILQHYGIHLNEHLRKTTCPFSSHQGGNERTPSFYYYPKTNTYHCFGCKKGSTPVDFVCNIENITKEKACLKIIENFNTDVDESAIYNRESFDERLSIMMQFSDIVREFRKENPSEDAVKFIENTCRLYDVVNSKLSLSNEALKELVDNLLIKGILYYKQCHQ